MAGGRLRVKKLCSQFDSIAYLCSLFIHCLRFRSIHPIFEEMSSNCDPHLICLLVGRGRKMIPPNVWFFTAYNITCGEVTRSRVLLKANAHDEVKYCRAIKVRRVSRQHCHYMHFLLLIPSTGKAELTDEQKLHFTVANRRQLGLNTGFHFQ